MNASTISMWILMVIAPDGSMGHIDTYRTAKACDAAAISKAAESRRYLKKDQANWYTCLPSTPIRK